MKKIFFAIVALLPVMAFAQDGKFTIQGTVGTYNAPAKIYVQYAIKDKVITDSVALKDGKFQFGGSVGAVPLNAYLILNDKGTGANYKDYKSFYIEKGSITITSKDSLVNAKVDGPKTNQENVR